VLKAAVKVLRLLFEVARPLLRYEAVIEVSRQLLRCQSRHRGVKAAIDMRH
jgi:hypothetical protein